MRYLLIVATLFCLISCKSTKAQDTTSGKPAKPVYRGEDIGIAPGQLKFRARIVSVNKQDTICGKLFDHTIELELLQIYLTGAATSNIPLINKVYTFASKEFSVNLRSGTIIEGLATEMLCRDATKSYFSLDDFEEIR
ncbi:hypothetical protein ACJD0Z_17645 [Flavobacteriaceae bacterium M23B6Z8]